MEVSNGNKQEESTVFVVGGKTIQVRCRLDDFCILQISRGFGPRQLELWLATNRSVCFPEQAAASTSTKPKKDVNPVIVNSFCSAYATTLVAVARNPHVNQRFLLLANNNQYQIVLTAQCIVKGAPPLDNFDLPDAIHQDNSKADDSPRSRVRILRTIASNTAGFLSLVEVHNHHPTAATATLIPRQFQKHLMGAGFPVIGAGRDAVSFRGEKVAFSVIQLELWVVVVDDSGIKKRRLLASVQAPPAPRLATILEREERFWKERHGKDLLHNNANSGASISSSSSSNQCQQQPTLPAEYAKGRAEFDGLEFLVAQQVVMIPRQGSVTLVERAVSLYNSGLITVGEKRNNPRILDLGTGSGCLLLSLLKRLETGTGVGIDISEKALQMAQQNAKRLGLDHKCQFQVGLFDKPAVQGPFDIFVCNPPYHRRGGRKILEAASLAYEPRQALIVDNESNDYVVHYRDALKGIQPLIPPNGTAVVVFEVFRDNLDPVTRLFEAMGVERIAVGKDRKGCIRSIQGFLSWDASETGRNKDTFLQGSRTK